MFNTIRAIPGIVPFIPHGHCYLWKTGLVGLHITADALIALAYYSISIALFYFVRRRKDLPFKWIFLLFGAFIISCGTTHLFEIWTLWHPTYWLSGGMKAITALVSVVTAIELVPLIPKVLALPSPENLKQLNKELQASQAKFAGILDIASDAIISIDVNQRITLFNRAAEKVFGYPAHEAIGQPLDLLLPQRFTAAHHRHISTFSEGNGNTRRMGDRSEIFGRRKDGSEFPAEASISRLEIAGKKTFTAFLRDISERKQAEAELQEQQRFLRQVIDTNPNLIFVKDWNGRFTLVNQAVADLYHTTVEELIGKTDADFSFNSTEVEQYRAADRQVIQTLQPTNLEEPFTTLEGTIRYFQSTKHPLISSNGQTRYVLGVANDITALKQTEAALQQKTEELEGFFSSTLDLLCIATTKGIFLRLNPQWERTLGYRLEELEGQYFLNLVHPEDLQPTLKAVAQLSAQQPILSFVNRYRHREGTYRWLEWRSVPKGDYIYAAARDITDRKQAEAELRLSQERLRLALEASGEGLWDWEIDTGEVYRSPQYLKILGYEEENFSNTFGTWEKQIHPEDYDRVLTCLDDHLKNQTVQFFCEYRMRTQSGEWKWIADYGKVVSWDQQNQPLRMIGTHRDITDRKQAEAKLRLIDFCFESSSVSATWIKADARIVRVNAAACETLGYSREELQSMYVYELDPNFPVEVWADHWQMLKQQKHLNFVTQLRTKAGKLLPVEVTLNYVEYDGEEYNFASMQDISDRVAAEAELRESEARFRLALQAAKFGTWEYNFGTGELFQSEISEIYGLQPGQTHTTYAEWIAQIHPDDRDWVETEFDRAIQAAGEFSLEFRVVRPDGTVRWSLSTGAVVHDPAGQPLYAYGIAADITDRKQAEVEQKAQQAFLRQVIDTVPNIIFVKDKEGHILIVNQAGADAHGTTVEAMLGKREIDFNSNFTLEQLEEFLDTNRQVMQTRQSHFNLSQMIVNGAGETHWYQTVINPLIDVHEQVTGIVGATTDVTALKETEQALQQAKEEAEAANRAKSIFLANMSHELRTPLNVMLGFVQVMQRDSRLILEHRDNLKIVYRSGAHLLGLINDVLDLSKIEAGHITLDESSIDLIDLLQSLEQMFRQRAETKGLHLRLILASNLPQYVTIDANKLRQILINLLSNAIKFTEQGHVILRVGVEHEQEEICPITLRFEVNDTGVGIHPSEIETIFNAFVQTQAGKISPEGTGLGLTISRKFAQIMGGDITVQSSLGRGSTFVLTVPVYLARSIDVSTLSSRCQVIGLAPNQATYRILVVDDQSENRKLLVRLLTQIGLEVREAINGQVAITQWQQWQPHLIYMDIRMPLLSGYEATQQIREMEQSRREKNAENGLSSPSPTIIIALTAQASKSDRTLAIAAGCDDYLGKPFQEEVVLSKMAAYLGLKYLCATETATALQEEMYNASKPLHPSDLQEMPPEWVAALRQSAQLCDDNRMKTLIEQIPPERAFLIKGLNELVQNYSFKQIVALTNIRSNP